MPSTIRLHRVLATTPERLYRSLLTSQSIVRWLPSHGFTHMEHKTDAWVGGCFRTHLTQFATGNIHSFAGQYLELIPNRQFRYTDIHDTQQLHTAMITTVSMKPVPGGTELAVRQEGIPKAIPPEAQYLGWHESMMMLSLLVGTGRYHE